MEKTRIDKWLWATRFYKTRSLASHEVTSGHVQVGGQDVKPSREVKLGETITVRQGSVTRTVVVKGISEQRGSASMAQLLYEETPESVAKREAAQLQRRLAPEPALTISQGRPTKRDRRDMQKVWSSD
ncbi:RNA-binding S4 domain-containing protein [Rhodoferax aquaticus]|uniref:RNA-binding S4 domain-containing protein n=1 Tax=Rhodoferax aquaticus TaxID=2527691 RepID=A0A515ENA0_9BURK|nr:S4 domain-containing protein [Rhodoferax aquaticus]QDL54139.1 RNA-binding S4 domain-containing protein [Rhodoferax aquaticus]